MVDLLARFPEAKRSGEEWKARCPAHEDTRASLSIGHGRRGQWLVNCHAGCSFNAILAALHIEARDLEPLPTASGRRGVIDATYEYCDEAGALLYEVVRYTPKGFKQRRPDGRGGWLWKLDQPDQGVFVRRVLFGLPELRHQSHVYVAEGEKDVFALRAIGLPATTNAGGAGPGKWLAVYVDQLTAAGVTAVTILPDQDEAGRKHSDAIACSCRAGGLKTQIVHLPGLPNKGDVSDWLASGRTAEDLAQLVEATPWDRPSPAGEGSAPVSNGPAQPIAALATILHEIDTLLRTYVVLSEEQVTILSLWVGHTHAIAAADATPYIHVTSPEPECGKTRLLEVLCPLVARGWMTSHTTKATLVRKVDRQQPTLLLDELDAALNTDREYVEALRGVLNGGYLRSGTYWMCVGQGATLSDKDFHTFCPKVLSGIGTLPRTVATRSVPIQLRRRGRLEPIAKWREREGKAQAAPIAERLAAWAPGAVDTLRAMRPAFPDGLRDRAEDVLEPLLAIAELAGDPWPTRARAAAVALLRTRPVQNESMGIQLLADIHVVFVDAGMPDLLASKDLRASLSALEDRPWGTWGHQEKPISGVALAKLLAAFQIVPTEPVRIGAKVARSYRRQDFEDVWTRYLPDDSLHRNNANKDGEEPTESHSLQTRGVTSPNGPVEPVNTGPCYGVTNESPDPDIADAEWVPAW